MPGQIVEITTPGLHLAKSRGFLQVKEKDSLVGQVALDDLLAVIVGVQGCSISTTLMDELSQRNIMLVVCGKNFLPNSFILPVVGHGRQFQVMQAQMNLSEPRRKRAWQKIVRAKILNQADLLTHAGKNNIQLIRLAKMVKSGDLENCEAQAARIYWQRLFGNDFRRDHEAMGLNSSLNYIYTVIRACVARGVSAAGLHPSFSLCHKNPQNPLNLVDDLVEPFRPIADYRVWQNKACRLHDLSPEIKASLSSITTLMIPIKDETSPLSLAAVKVCRSFAGYCLGEADELLLPTLPIQLDASTP
ncbi:MAG: type II CRISPR-associated endonuclease Cas1 [Nitrospira sp. SB0661_bin_20]|nr:type II CRISPR-associated endonuclease Cas1 [Nitrospira sp. SB0661_bin_20]MYJ23153.1 type II CRISPR-associated endonuclease Cas1 [Nitrospira sp. SB0673_bin_12]